MIMRRLLFASVVIALAGCATSTPAQDPQTGVREGEQARFRAMVANDLDKLAPLLADDLVYVHTDGVVESKTEFLQSLRTGTRRYVSIEPNDVRVRTYGNTAVATGQFRAKVISNGADREFDARYTAIYRASGKGWQLVSWQSTRMQH
jgi:ketosteroid isomerase-like protein